MKEHRYLFFACFMLIVFAISGNSCNNIRGFVFRINRHGEDFQELRRLKSYIDYWGYREIISAKIIGTAINQFCIVYDSDDTELIDIHGSELWFGDLSNQYELKASLDGNYLYQGNQRRHLNNFYSPETVFADTTSGSISFGSISENNRYICYVTAGNRINLWDMDTQTNTSFLITDSTIGKPIYLERYNKIYYRDIGHLIRMNPDGSMREVVKDLTSDHTGLVLYELRNKDALLIAQEGELNVISLPGHEVLAQIPINDDAIHGQAYAPYSNEFYYVNQNVLYCCDLNTYENRVVYRGDKHGVKLGKGMSCTFDGDYILLGCTKQIDD